MMRILRMVAGFALGTLVGVGLVMLFAPRSGAETRRLLQERAQAILEEGQQAAEARRLELTAQFEALKKPDLPR
jgi:gas vesicle protein